MVHGSWAHATREGENALEYERSAPFPTLLQPPATGSAVTIMSVPVWKGIHLLLLTIDHEVNNSFIKLVHEASPIDKSLLWIGAGRVIDSIDSSRKGTCPYFDLIKHHCMIKIRESTQPIQTQKGNKMKNFQKAFLAVLVTTLFSMTTLTPQAFALGTDEAPSYELMAADLLMLKPLGFAATAVGCVIFTFALPLTVWSKKRISQAGQRFVVDPGVYTFVRPLGHDIHDLP